MKTFTLLRVTKARQDGTFGVFIDADCPFAITAERAWLNNARGKSCIPVGEYTCKRVNSPKFGDTFEVTSVPGRSEILFHKGNIDDDSHGCILVGEQYAVWQDGSCSIAASAVGFTEFKQRTTVLQEFKLIIKDAL